MTSRRRTRASMRRRGLKGDGRPVLRTVKSADLLAGRAVVEQVPGVATHMIIPRVRGG